MAQDEIEHDTEALRQRLVNELADAPQGTRDGEMPMPGNPNPTGETGPSPGPDSVPEGEAARMGEKGILETGEEEDPGDADAGGVNATNAGA